LQRYSAGQYELERLLIEPVPHCFERQKVNFQDSQRFRFEQVAIGASPGQASFYYVDTKANQNLPACRYGLIALDHSIDLLHVDAEGHDYEVLKTVDFAKHAPLSIFVEHRHLSFVHRAEMLRFLRKHGYSVRDCGADYFAVNEEANRRLQRSPG
jgi:FkbM family methyltransferase